MRDVHLMDLLARQSNRVARAQLRELGFTEDAIQHRLETGRLVLVEPGVLAAPPVLRDDRGRWFGATLTAPDTWLNAASACAAYGFWTLPRLFETVVRPGSGGPRRHGGVLVFRSATLAGETRHWDGIPIVSPERALLDLAAGGTGDKALARALREAVRLKRTLLHAVADALGRHHGGRGTARLAAAVTRYAGLPLERARCGAEVRAMELLRGAGSPLPDLNRRIAGEEADLSWPLQRVIIELDGGPFHLDRGEDARKEAAWRAAGWSVDRLPSDDVYERPERLLVLAASRMRP